MKKIFYVYQLIDPRTMKPFYIGKGKDNRIDDHEKDAARGIIHPKCSKIREIQKSGMVVIKEKIKHFSDEDQAFEYEKQLIAKIGMDQLTNLTAGGRANYPALPADKDLSAHQIIVYAFCRYMRTCHGKIPGFRFAGEWFALPDSFFNMIKAKVGMIIGSRGDNWFIKECKKHNTIISFRVQSR